jgi:hypothetical protein
MLKSQKQLLKERIDRYKDFKDKERRKNYMQHFALKASDEVKRGQLNIQKEVFLCMYI